MGMGQIDRCAVFGCNNDRIFAEKYIWKFSFARKARLKVLNKCPPGHPIILLKSNKFNMAAVSVKRYIEHCFNSRYIHVR